MHPGSRRYLAFAILVALVGTGRFAVAVDVPPLPKVAEGWSIELMIRAPRVQYPTAVVAASDGSVYLGQDFMDMPGPVNSPVDLVLLIRADGSTRVFADKLHAVMGLEWADGMLYVVHAPFLSRFRDTDGDGAADQRQDLITGLGPKVPGFNGLNDHVASGVRLGIDNFLYLAVGDKGFTGAKGADGKTIAMSTGGVIRVRPDGTDLEVVSTGERNPLSVALTDRDEVFTFGNDDDSHLWPNSLTHHIVGGHYGYPYEFLSAPHRALPIVAGQTGGAGAQGVCSNSGALPERFRGNLFFNDWGLQTIARYEVAPTGATFKLVRREAIVEKGALSDFRPFGIAPTADGLGFWITDWAHNGWLSPGPPVGRLFRLTYTGPDRPEPIPVSRNHRTAAAELELLDDATLAVRFQNQRLLARRGAGAVTLLAASLANQSRRSGLVAGEDGEEKPTPRIQVHALWALDAIGSPEAREAIRAALGDKAATVRAQAARSVGIRREAEAEVALVGLLDDADAPVRREAAIALGRLKVIQPATRLAIYQALSEYDPTVAWSIRRAIREQKGWDQNLLAAALADPARRDSALTLADNSFAPEVVRVLAAELASATRASNDPSWRARVVSALGGLYAKVPASAGHWFGPNPLAGPRPRATEAWDAPSSDAVLIAMAKALGDADLKVRRQGIIACLNIGPRSVPLLRALLEPGQEADPTNALAVVRFLGEQRDAPAIPGLARVVADPKRSDEVRLAALDSLVPLAGPQAINARLMVLYDAASPDALIARALPTLGQARLLPSNDLIGFLDHQSPLVRAAALGSFPTDRPLAPAVVESILIHHDDPAPEVRLALARALAAHRIKAAVPILVAMAEGTDPALRAEAVRGLAAMPDSRAVGPLANALNDRDPSLRRVALDGLGTIRAEAVPELTARAGRGEFVGPSALAVERLLATFHPLLDWRVIGPLPQAAGPIFGDARSLDFARSEPGLDGKPTAWRVARADPKTGGVTLDDPRTADGSTSFAVAEVTSPEARSALLVVDSTGPCIVAVDERPLAHFTAAPVGEIVRIDLRAGLNRILLRARQGGSPGTVRVELSDAAPSSATGGMVARAVPIQREGLRAVALRRSGDPRSGEAIFREAGGVGCARCHGAGGQAATTPGLGPLLDGLALKYDKAELIRSILEPSSRIAIGYVPVVVERTDGKTVTGLLRVETIDRIELTQLDGEVISVPRGEVESKRSTTASFMPEGLVDGLNPAEFADLVAYLMTLKSVQSPAGSSPGPP